MIETSSKTVRKYLATFGNLRKSSKIFGHLRNFSEDDRKCSYELRTVFGEFSKIFGNLRKCSLVDTNFIFSCSISQSFATLTCEILSTILEDKIRIHARACNMLLAILKSRHFFNQIEVRPKPIVTCSLAFSRA